MPKIGLGTVQFGTNYGVSNTTGITPPAEVENILEIAAQNGIQILDTAANYGDAETVLGEALPPTSSFQIISKAPSLAKSKIETADIDHLSKSFYQSLKRLKQENLYGLYMHDPGDLQVEGSDLVYEHLCRLREQGLVQKVGVSVYNPQEALSIAERYQIDIIQIPINVFDQRFITSGALSFLKEKKVEVHARSVFLQGLLLMPPGEPHSFFEPIKETHAAWFQFVEQNNITPFDAALAFLRNIGDISYMILGVNTGRQLLELLNSNIELPMENFRSFAIDNPNMINPSKWKI